MGAKRIDYLTISIVRYEEPSPFWFHWRYMGVGRRALDFCHWSIIIECWWIKGGLEYS
jgi:hypothetical protein